MIIVMGMVSIMVMGKGMVSILVMVMVMVSILVQFIASWTPGWQTNQPVRAWLRCRFSLVRRCAGGFCRRLERLDGSGELDTSRQVGGLSASVGVNFPALALRLVTSAVEAEPVSASTVSKTTSLFKDLGKQVMAMESIMRLVYGKLRNIAHNIEGTAASVDKAASVSRWVVPPDDDVAAMKKAATTVIKKVGLYNKQMRMSGMVAGILKCDAEETRKPLGSLLDAASEREAAKREAEVAKLAQ
ncbi:hypothetical protein P43SY_002955 [Pythium insidiosum]|uniref:Uncharacterized protein n=1 Tax=Pythium insidiosum TaxID=114742 RepID=A0AAD5L8R0_PYTIN|nr:hypothetical protein P43SY_002955 [Pythium insidiosum]